MTGVSDYDIGWPSYSQLLAMMSGGLLCGGISNLLVLWLDPDPIRLWGGVVSVALGLIGGAWWWYATSHRACVRRRTRRAR